MNLHSFFGELRRRRVFWVAAVYAVVAWLVIQIAETTFPYLALPAWTVTLVIVLALLGFPIALVLAWAFDLTPEGVVRTEAPESSRAAAPGSRRAWSAQLAAAERLRDAPPQRERLEAFLLGIPHAVSRSGAESEWALLRVMEYWYVALARLHEREDNLSPALGAHRRRFFFYGGESYIAQSLREEGRLAALAGDREGTIRAYRHYLALRYDPEPALRPEVERVRSELTRLEGWGER